MYPWSKIKDETINFVKRDYVMSLLITLALSFFIGVSTGIITFVVQMVTGLLNIPLAFLTSSDNTFVCIIGTVGILLITLVVSLLTSVISFFVQGIAFVSIGRTFSRAKATGKISFDDLLFPFTSNFKNIALIEFKKSVKLTLWSLCFVIPGIIKYYEYFMVDFLLADNPNLSEEQVFRISKETTNGEKGNIFLTSLALCGISMLGMLLCCVGQVFLAPFVYAALCEVYYYLRAKAIAIGQANEMDLISM